MSLIALHPSSFRDPRGQVFTDGRRILRSVTNSAAADFDFVRGTGLIQNLINDGMLLDEIFVDKTAWMPAFAGMTQSHSEFAYLLEHPRLPFISYPYEWPFVALKSAAILQLDILLKALEYGVTLTDASAYNIQFIGARPVFIDHLAFRRYQPGEIWQGYRQFCQQYLNPLLLQAYVGLPYQEWYRGALEGITTRELNQLLPFYRKFSPAVFLHVVLSASLQKNTSNAKHDTVSKVNFPLPAFKKLLTRLRQWVIKLTPKANDKTVWEKYSQEFRQPTAKKDLVIEFMNTVKPQLVYDLGCNTGDYAQLALQSGAQYVVGLDSDQGALQQAFDRATQEKLAFLPLCVDLANPSPAQGWNNHERQSIVQRGPADAVLALAVVHHLAITRNIPLAQIAHWLLELAPQGLVEFVPKSDPKLRGMLQNREDIFKNYSQDYFMECLKPIADIIKVVTITDTGRSLIWYKKKMN